MTTETPAHTVDQAVNAVMNTVLGIGKNQRNTTPGQNYNFRGIDAVINAVGPALRAHGVIVVPRVLKADYSEILVGAKQTKMRLVTLEVEFTWRGPDGSTFVSSACGEAFDSGDKATSKAHSVAYRTNLIQVLCIPTDEPDPDSYTYERSAPDTRNGQTGEAYNPPRPAQQGRQRSGVDTLKDRTTPPPSGDLMNVLNVTTDDLVMQAIDSTSKDELRNMWDAVAGHKDRERIRAAITARVADLDDAAKAVA